MHLPLNLVPITTFRTAEFLDCIDIYNNEPIVVVKNNLPYLVGFPMTLVEAFKTKSKYTEEVPVEKSTIQRAKAFKGNYDEFGKVFILTQGKKKLYAFVRYQHHTTYPTVMGLFENGSLYNDLLWDQAKPFVPPYEAKLTSMARFLKYKQYDKIDRAFILKHEKEVFDVI